MARVSLARIFIFVGAVLFALGAYLIVSWLLQGRRLTAKVPGTVLGYLGNRGKGHKANVDEIAHLNVEFFIGEDRYVCMEKQALKPSGKYGPGTRVEVRYNPAYPSDFRVADNKSDYWGAWALMGVGLGMALLGFVFG